MLEAKYLAALAVLMFLATIGLVWLHHYSRKDGTP